MHPAVRDWCERWATSDPVDVVEVGARNINGTIRDLWPRATWCGIDVEAGDGVDIVIDAADWHPQRLFDVAVSTEVLEHAQRWQDIVRNLAAALKPGGLLILTAAGPGRSPHGVAGAAGPAPGEWYRNIEPGELDLILAEVLQGGYVIDVEGADVRAAGRR